MYEIWKLDCNFRWISKDKKFQYVFIEICCRIKPKGSQLDGVTVCTIVCDNSRGKNLFKTIYPVFRSHLSLFIYVRKIDLNT